MTYYTPSVHDGVIQEFQIWVFTLITIKVGQPTKVILHHRYESFHIFTVRLSIRPYLGHYDPSGGKPPGHFLFMQTKGLHIMIHEPTLKLSWRIT